ncbi:MAG TPA: DUF808 domain-containing protein, partial [Allosphingosinicella sp.]
TPTYVSGLHPDRELPIIGRIAFGSLKNKLLILLPGALLLSAFAPWAITPLLMIGAAFLCFEGAEKLIESAHGDDEEIEEVTGDPAHIEAERIGGAIRTDLILSAEIMAIALAEVASEPFLTRSMILALVAIAITIGVYGLVGLIVKMDDIGLHMAERRDRGSQALGRALVHAMPKVMAALSTIGIAAMIWVGGGIIVHGLETFGFAAIGHFLHDVGAAAARAMPALGGVVEWTVGAVGAGLVGLAIGAVIVAVHHMLVRRH